MENHRIVLFNILRKRTKDILQSLQDSNNNLIREVRELFEGIPGIIDEELARIETVDHLWEFLVTKEIISKDKVQMLKNVARFVKSNELKKEVESYEYERSGMVQKVGLGIAKTAKLVIKTGLPLGIGLAVLSFCGENEIAKQVVLEKLVLPPLVKLDEVCEGSVCFVIQTSSLSSLKQLWTSYNDGSLKEKLKKVINEIDEVRKLTQGTEIDVTVEIDEEEYREACWVLVLAEIEQAEVEQESSKSFQRPRRHSLSCEREFLPTRSKTQLSWQEWTALKEAEKKLANETRRRIYLEKQVEELRQEIEVLKGTKDTTKSKKEDVIALEEKNQELMTELEAPKTTDLKKVEKLKEAIECREEILKNAVEANDRIEVGAAYTQTGVLYYALGTLYKETYEKENCEDTMKKAESCFKEAADSWEKLNAQLNDEDELKSEVSRSMFITYKFLTTVLLVTKQTEEALIVSDRTRDPGLVDTMIKKFQMNKNDILNESMRYANVSSILENKSFSVLIFSVRDANINIWILECQKPSFFLTTMVPNESGKKISVDTYITNLVAAANASSDGEPLERLYELLIAPVLPNLTQDEVVIIADGPLQLVPFAALRNPKTGQFLSDTKSIRYAPSLTAMKIWKECPVDYHGNTGALVVGDPDVGRVMVAGEECESTSLPYALREAKVVGAILNASPLVGTQATKHEVLKMLQEHLAVIHIAAMGNEKGEILLAPSASTREVIPEEHDYMLTIEEVQEMRIHAQLVILSMPWGGGSRFHSEITMGKVDSMSQAFLAAGARAVVASLWAIDDEVTLSFMVSFYTFLKMGESASKSLQYAMNDIRGEYEEPKYWAPFFLIGDDVTISV